MPGLGRTFYGPGPALATDVELASALLNRIVVVDAGAIAATPRPAGVAVVYWKCNAGVNPTNKIAGDIVFNAEA